MEISEENSIFFDTRRFSGACLTICAREHARSGIGTLAEKTLHAALKLFIEPDETLHEIKVGRSYADVYNSNGIYEIQTRSFNILKKKLPAMLKKEQVTVVYPIAATKNLIWMDVEANSFTKPRKSPKLGKFFDAFAELYKLDTLICSDRLKIVLMLIDMDEYRLLNGWSGDGKRGSTRYERIPTALKDSVILSTNEDYLGLLPQSLPESFTSRALARAAKISLSTAQVTLRVLVRRGAIICIGKEGRLNLYEKTAANAPCDISQEI